MSGKKWLFATIKELFDHSTVVTAVAPQYKYSEAAIFVNETDEDTAFELIQERGEYGIHPIILTKADIDRLLQGGEMIVWGQGEYSVIIFYRGTIDK